MLAFRSLGYRPPTIAPVRPPQIGQVTPGQAKGVAIVGTLLDAAFAGATAWVGYYTGTKATGLLSTLGYGVAIFAALRGVIDVASLALLATGALPASGQQQTVTPGFVSA